MAFVKSNILFLCGMVCLFAANIPSIYAGINGGDIAPFGFLIIVQIGLVFYLLDSIYCDRPMIFMFAGILNNLLNLSVIILKVML